MHKQYVEYGDNSAMYRASVWYCPNFLLASDKFALAYIMHCIIYMHAQYNNKYGAFSAQSL